MKHTRKKHKYYPFINTDIQTFDGRGIYVLTNESRIALYGLEPYSLNGFSVIRAYKHNPGAEEYYFSDPADLCIRGKVVGYSP